MLTWLADRFRALLNNLRWEAPIERVPDAKEKPLPPPPVYFESFEVVAKTPANSSLRERQLVSVVYHDKPLWTMFRCPCGCGEVISLPMQAPHNPRWRLLPNETGRPTLSPSVWRNKGCMSHFWIRDGRVYWTRDTGTEPWRAQPDKYSKRV